MNFDDLWIGDLVWIKSKKRNGKWEGKVHPSSAKVKINHQTYLVPLSDLSEAHHQEEVDEPSFVHPPPIMVEKKAIFDPVATSIDLHIEVLQPRLTHARAEIILDFQLQQCRAFVAHSIQQRRSHVTLIHGRGEGVLRMEVAHLLKEFDSVNFTLPANNGGATEVWFQYT